MKFICVSSLIPTLLMVTSALDIKMPDAQSSFEANPDFPPNERFSDIAILTTGNFSKVVLDSLETWVVIIHDGTMTRSWKTMAATSRGHFWLGMIDKTKEHGLLRSLKFSTEYHARVFPHGDHIFKVNNAVDVKSPMEARQAAIKSIPNKIQKLNTANLREFLLDSYSSSPSRFPAIVLTDEPEMSGLNKALAVRFDKYFNFAHLINPTTNDLASLGIQSLFFEYPTIIILVIKGDQSSKASDGRLSTDVNAIAFDRQTMGDLDYPHVVQFLFSVNNQFRYTLPGDNKANQQLEAEMLDIRTIEGKRFQIKEKHEEEEDKFESMTDEEFEQTRESRRDESDRILNKIEEMNRNKTVLNEDGEMDMVFSEDENTEEMINTLLKEAEFDENLTEDDLRLNDVEQEYHPEIRDVADRSKNTETHDEL